MFAEAVLTAGIALILYAFVKFVTQNNNFFTIRGIKQMQPQFLFGNTGSFLTSSQTAVEFNDSLYYAFPNEKVNGFFDFLAPIYLLRDLDLIKQLAVKDFDHFEDHRSFVDGETDNLLSNSLFFMKGEKWRDMRATLSPSFTGSKMRQMFDLVSECADELVSNFRERSEKGEEIHYEMKSLFSRYTNDVIASCAFGIKVNSLKDPNNEFFENGQLFTKFGSTWSMLKFIMLRAFPRICDRLGIDFLAKKTSVFFRSMVLDTMEVREEKKIFRPDMINILMQVRKGTLTAGDDQQESIKDGFATVEESNIGKAVVKRKWTDSQIVAQCLIFFVAGFDTTSNLIMMLAYELVANQDVQQKLYEEIKATHESRGGRRLDYETLQKMKYMDQVITESLRMWPPVPMVDRLCVKDYEFDDGEVKLNIKEGTSIQIPIYGIQHDSKYYENPDKFDPERFSDENKDNILPGSYIPFGVGPRNCIGSRFALMEIKAIIYYLLLGYTMVPNEKTEIPIVLEKKPFALKSRNGVNVQFKPRN